MRHYILQKSQKNLSEGLQEMYDNDCECTGDTSIRIAAKMGLLPALQLFLSSNLIKGGHPCSQLMWGGPWGDCTEHFIICDSVLLAVGPEGSFDSWSDPQTVQRAFNILSPVFLFYFYWLLRVLQIICSFWGLWNRQQLIFKNPV